jgi:hypothetical protein
LITVSTGASSTLRVYAWRALRAAGAVYLQQSVALLPKRRETEKIVARLLERLHRDGGAGRVLSIALIDERDERTVIEQFRAERADEYGEVCARTPAFLQEIQSERERGRATYMEVEESEADLDRLRTWLERIRSRDYFGAEGREAAEAAVAHCAAVLADFEAEALTAESTVSGNVVPPEAARPPLRSVKEEPS